MDYNNNPNNNFNGNSDDNNNFSQNPYESNNTNGFETNGFETNNFDSNPYDNKSVNNFDSNPYNNQSVNNFDSNPYNNQGVNNFDQNPYNNQNYNQNMQYTGVPYATAIEPKQTPVMAIVSLVLGIIGILTCCFGIGAIFGLVAIILAGISLSKKKGTGFAIAGLVTGVLGLLFGGYMCVCYGLAFASGDMEQIWKQSFERAMQENNGNYDYDYDYDFDSDTDYDFDIDD